MLGLKTRKYFNVNNIVGVAIITCIFCIVNLQYKKQINTSTNHRIENVSSVLNYVEYSQLFKNFTKKLKSVCKVVFVVWY